MTTITKLGSGHYRYRNGEPATVLTVERPGVQPIVSMGDDGVVLTHNRDGKFYENDAVSKYDLVPIPRKVWVNLYRNEERGGDDVGGFLHIAQEHALRSIDHKRKFIACVEIELPEGET